MYRAVLRQKLFFFFLDCLLIVGVFCAAFYLRFGTFERTDFDFFRYITNALFIVPVWLLLLVWGGRYSLREKTWSEILRIVSISSLAGTMLFVLTFFFRIIFFERETSFSRALVLLIFLLGTVAGMLSIWLERYWEKQQVKKKRNVLHTLIIGNNRAAEELIHALQKRHSRYQPVAILAPFGGSKKELHGVPVLGKLDALERVTEQEHIQCILLCDGVEQMLNLLAFAEGRFLEFKVSPEILGVFRENITPEVLANKILLSLKPSPLFGWGQFWKRGFDVIVSLICILFLSPIWLLQKIFRGTKPLFAKENRVGAAGRTFQMFRYHSHNENSLWHHLPNMLNIIRGEMSLVGPRPALPEEWEKMPAHFRRRMILRPGMLGIWQLKKLQGNEDDFEAMCRDDIRYIQNWSFWHDLQIIVKSKYWMVKAFFQPKK